jgi:hypothetical protein
MKSIYLLLTMLTLLLSASMPASVFVETDSFSFENVSEIPIESDSTIDFVKSKFEMNNVNKLKENYPELVKEYSEMDKDQLLEQICAEVVDLHLMEERVKTFMSEFSLNLSNTNYTIESIKSIISSKQEHDINVFCKDLLDDFKSDNERIEDLKSRAEQV